MFKVDLEKNELILEESQGAKVFRLDTPEAFALLSEAWLRCGFDNKYIYSFSWMGRPIIQLPEDLLRIQEAIFDIRPDLIIETGVAHGGSLVFYAGILKALGKGRVIGVDIEIRPQNRKAIEEHILYERITLVEGDSISPQIIQQVHSQVRPGEKVLVILDSKHTREHVLAELKAYSSLVSPGSYIIAADGIMEKMTQSPQGREDWSWNNPKAAAEDFLRENENFLLEPPRFFFNEAKISEKLSYWRGGWLRRVR